MKSAVPLLVGLFTGTTLSAPANPPLSWKQWAPLPIAEGFAGGFAGVTADALVFAGGTNFAGRPPWEGGKKIWSDGIYVLTDPEQSWKPAGKLPHPLGYGASVSVPEGFVIIGGNLDDKPVDEVWLLHWNGREIETKPLPGLPAPVAYCSAVLYQRGIYCVASPVDPTDKTVSAKFWCLDLDDLPGGWKELPPWPGPSRIMPVMATLGEEIFLISGKANHPTVSPEKAYLNDALAYHVLKGSWRSLAALPFPASAVPSPAPVVDGNILILGGNDGSLAEMAPGPQRPDFPSIAYAYDSATDEWKEGGQLPFTQKVTPVALWRGSWVVVSGEKQPGIRTTTVWAGEAFHQTPQHQH